LGVSSQQSPTWLRHADEMSTPASEDMPNGGDKLKKSTVKSHRLGTYRNTHSRLTVPHLIFSPCQPTVRYSLETSCLCIEMSLCKVCEETLVLRLDPEEDVDDEAGAGPSTSDSSVPDDLELPCGCHFHW
jgi:hypothetical protein